MIYTNLTDRYEDGFLIDLLNRYYLPVAIAAKMFEVDREEVFKKWLWKLYEYKETELKTLFEPHDEFKEIGLDLLPHHQFLAQYFFHSDEDKQDLFQYDLAVLLVHWQKYSINDHYIRFFTEGENEIFLSDIATVENDLKEYVLFLKSINIEASAENKYILLFRDVCSKCVAQSLLQVLDRLMYIFKCIYGEYKHLPPPPDISPTEKELLKKVFGDKMK